MKVLAHFSTVLPMFIFYEEGINAIWNSKYVSELLILTNNVSILYIYSIIIYNLSIVNR